MDDEPSICILELEKFPKFLIGRLHWNPMRLAHFVLSFGWSLRRHKNLVLRFFFCCCPPTAQRPMRSRQSITARLIIGLIRHDTDRYGTDPLPSAAIYRSKFCEHFIWPLHAHLMTSLLNFKLTYLKFK